MTSSDALLKVLKALADETRLKIVKTMANKPNCGTSDCSKKLDLTQPTISHHMKVILEANIAKETKNGTSKCYTLNKEFLLHLGIDLSKL
jgi:ArsR family transcriptional regulator, arsenate/arsenite/antimonite-responsive transcriptional repressor